MKIWLFFIIMSSLLNFSSARAQDVHKLGVKALDFSASKTDIGIMPGLSLNINFSDYAFVKLRALAEFGRLYNFKYSQFGADIMVYYNPFYISDFVQFNAGAGITAGYEKVSGITKEKASSIGFMAGIKGGVEIEAFLSDQVGFFVNGNQAYLLKKSLGTTYYEVGVGIRIFLNNYY